jgi:hypothetical protein
MGHLSPLYMSLFKIFFFLFVTHIYSQVKSSVLTSTLTSVGASSLPVFDHKYVVRQSIGQDGIIGKANLNVASIQQGFLVYFKSFSPKKLKNKDFEFVIYPNPFVAYLNIDFFKNTRDNVSIKIFDVLGKIYSSTKYLPTDKITIPLQKLSSGNYLVEVKTGEHTVTKKIFKIEP